MLREKSIPRRMARVAPTTPPTQFLVRKFLSFFNLRIQGGWVPSNGAEVKN